MRQHFPTQEDVSFQPELHQANIWGYYESLLPHGETFWAAEQRSFVVQGYTAADRVLRSRTFSADHPFRRSRLAFGRTVIDTEGRDHRAQRQFVSAELSGGALRGIVEKTVLPVVDHLVQAAVRRRVTDFHQQYGLVLPWRVACRLVGVEESAASALEPAVVALTRYLDDSTLPTELILRSREAIEAHTRERLEQATSGLLARAKGVITDGVLSEDAAVRTTAIVLAAATQTTVGALGIMMHTLVTQPAWQTALRAGEVSVPAFVREILRWEPPLHQLLRFATETTRLGKHHVAAGSPIQVNLASANRDPEIFPFPDLFDPTRTGAADLTFGRGIHACPGAQLATAELELTLQGFLDATSWISADHAAPLAGHNFPVAPELRIRCEGKVD